MDTTRLLAASAALALALSLVAVPVLAADQKIMPGSACQLANTLLAVGSNVRLNRQSGRLDNVEQQLTVSITCPVVKDLARIQSAAVVVFDRNPIANEDVQCTLKTMRQDGGVQQLQTLRTTGSSSGATTLTFGAQAAAAKGAYDLECQLPPLRTAGGGAIVSYRIVEE